MADDVALRSLREAGFFTAGGRMIDMWPLYASYFQLAARKRASFGWSSIHVSPLILRTQTQPDLMTMRVQLGLAALCPWTKAAHTRRSPRRGDSRENEHEEGGTWEPPCGLGTIFEPQAAFVREMNAECTCGLALSVGTGKWCNATPGTTRLDGTAMLNATMPAAPNLVSLPQYMGSASRKRRCAESSHTVDCDRDEAGYFRWTRQNHTR